MRNDWRAWRDVAEILLDARLHVIRSDITGNHEHGIRRPVVRPKPVLHILERRGVEVVHRPDDRPRIRVSFRERVLGDRDPRLPVRLVLTLTFLVLHDTALFVEAGRVDGAKEVTHAVGLEPENAVERGDRHVLEIIRAVLVGRAVEVRGAERLDGLEVVVVVVLAAVEHEVLEQVREPGLAGLLVLRADVIPDVDGGDWRLVVLVNQKSEPVPERVLLVWNVGDRRRLPAQCPGRRETRQCSEAGKSGNAH